jgi:hypothetical protein
MKILVSGVVDMNTACAVFCKLREVGPSGRD